MDRGLYIAASAMMTNQRFVEIVSANLANASTPGFKADQGVQGNFSDFLMRNMASGKDVGSMSMGAFVSEVRTNFGQGAINSTERSLDFALSGEGFFAVQAEAGVRFTRDGSFMRDAQGFLTGQSGYRVLGANGQPVQIPTDNVTVAPNGAVSANGQIIGQIGVFAVATPAHEGEGLFSGAVAGQAAGQIVQGSLEQANINEVDQMTSLMSAMRTFESSQRVLKAIDTTLQRAANEIGRIG